MNFRQSLAAVVGATASAAAMAAPVTVSLTVDNVYGLYQGGPGGAALALVGTDANWPTVETWMFDAAPGAYVYVAGWDQGNPKGFQASVTTPDRTFHTNAVDWQAAIVPATSLPGWTTSGSALPQLADLSAALAAASWQAIGAVQPNAGSPWGQRVAGADSWIWADAFSGGASEGQLVVFRTLAPVVANVPEPGTVALLGAGLAAVGLMARRGRRGDALRS